MSGLLGRMTWEIVLLVSLLPHRPMPLTDSLCLISRDPSSVSVPLPWKWDTLIEL